MKLHNPFIVVFYARILVATSSLEVVNGVEKIVVDGEVVEIKIIEEYGFNIGDDVCLYDNDDGTSSSNSDHDELGRDIDREADLLVENLAKDIAEASKEVTQNTETLEKGQ